MEMMVVKRLMRGMAQFAITFALTLLTLSIVKADEPRPFLHPLFADNMVLQRGIANPVWGWTTPGAIVTVQIAGRSVTTAAGPDGAWRVQLPKLPVGGPYTMSVVGDHKVTLKNVLVGDVWLCSGQSNMVFGVSLATNGAAEIAAANHPMLRLFTVGSVLAGQPRPSLYGQWSVCTPQSVAAGGWGGFSAVGYFFGRDLASAVHVPIGLVCSAWSGTPAEGWTSREALLNKLPEFRPQIAMVDAALNETTSQTKRLEVWLKTNEPGLALNWQAADLDDTTWMNVAAPGFFQDAGIPELNINGVVWFRHTFDLPAAAAGKAAVFHLRVDDNDTTWLNGTLLGSTYGAGEDRAYAVPAALLKPTGNVLAVRVFDTGGKGGIQGDKNDLRLDFSEGVSLPLAGNWRYRIGVSLNQAPPVPIDVLHSSNFPTLLFNGMIAPLTPFGLKGVIWYQGESNTGNGKQYQTLLPTLISDWRGRFGRNFPFLIVQLANFGQLQSQPGESNWAEVREAQLLTAKRLPKTGLAVAIDIGEANDIHPHNKQEVGRRLALAAEAIAYGKNIEYSGPIYRTMKKEGNSLRLYFTHVGQGLVASPGTKVIGFSIAGATGAFVWADAKIEGRTVVVSSASVPRPTKVRYGWADNPSCNLINTLGLPASPFRTDSSTTLTRN